MPDTASCGDNATAWATSSSDGVDNITLTYATPVVPSQINIYETYNPGAIVKVDVVDGSGIAATVYTAQEQVVDQCPRTLTIPVSGITSPVNQVVIYLDQTHYNGWDEIDAVELVGTAPERVTGPFLIRWGRTPSHAVCEAGCFVAAWQVAFDTLSKPLDLFAAQVAGELDARVGQEYVRAGPALARAAHLDQVVDTPLDLEHGVHAHRLVHVLGGVGVVPRERLERPRIPLRPGDRVGARVALAQSADPDSAPAATPPGARGLAGPAHFGDLRLPGERIEREAHHRATS